MSLFFESIRLVNGRVMNLHLHQARVARTCVANKLPSWNLKTEIKKQDIETTGVYKIRISYDQSEISTQIVPYETKEIYTLKIIESKNIEYRYKSEDRSLIRDLYTHREQADDILITSNGYLTDSSFSNVILFDGFRWVTPSDYLLAGTMREKLLSKNKIIEKRIHISELDQYQELKLINAMRPTSTSKSIQVNTGIINLR